MCALFSNRMGFQLALILVLSTVAFVDAQAQVRTAYTLQGTVTDDEGSPLPNVTIRLPDTSQGTITDLDGNYVFEFTSTEASVVVEFSFVGFATERITVTASGTRDVTLQQDILRFSEVVVTGTSGLTEKKQLGNSISTVEGDLIAESGAVDVTAALSGKITGALVSQTSGAPAGSISVKLRGTSTINSDAEPLYIIDGVIVDNSSPELVSVGSGGVQNRLVDLNPNDIERIEVIKGAAAAAVYGSRASNGVIQIFTKRGAGSVPRVTYSSTLMMNSVRETVKVNDAPFDWADPTDNSNLDRVPVSRFDYQDYIFTDGLGTDNYLSVSGRSGGTSYFLSGSYYFNEGIIRNSDFNRNTLRVNIGQTLSDWALVDVGASLARSASNDIPTGGPNFFDGAITTIQFQPHIADASPNELGVYPNIGNAFFGNPNEIVDQYAFTQDVNRLTGNVKFILTPSEGFSVNLITGYDAFTQVARGFKPVGGVAQPNGFSRRGDLTKQLYNIDLTARYETPLTASITSVTNGGVTYQYDKSESIINEATNLGPIVETVDGGTIVASSDLIAERSLRGAFLQETLSFKDRIFVTFAGRVDESSVFGEDNRTQFYPKLSGAYVLSDESFWTGGLARAVDLFKIRASWGKAGNLTGIGPFERFTNYNPISFGGQTGLVPSASLGNPDIKPETQTEFEIGADLSLLSSRLGIEFTYYDQTIDDLLLSRVLAPSTGATTRIENVGQLTNTGVELLMRGAVLQKPGLNLDVTVQFSRNRNEVTDLGGTRFAIGGFTSQWAIEGQPLGVFNWRAYARVLDPNGNPTDELLLTPGGLPQAERGDQAKQDATGNGALRDDNGQPEGTLLRVIVGDPNPDWTGSFITDFTYKQWSFRMQWDAVQGFDVMNWNRRNFDRHNYRGGYEYGLELKDGSTIPKGTANARGSGLILEEYVEDGSFVKLREIALTYTLRPRTRWVQRAQIRLSGRNLISIDDYRNYDPEVSIQGRETGIRGFDFGTVPIPRTVAVGVTLSF